MNTLPMNQIEPRITVNQLDFQWNYEEVKAGLAAFADKYKGLIVTDENLPDMEKARREIVHARTSITKFKTEGKKKLMEPANTFASQCDGLLAVVQEVEMPIVAQLRKYDEQRKEQIVARVNEYYQRRASEMSLDMKYWPESLPIQAKWLNKTQKWEDTCGDIDSIILGQINQQREDEARERLEQQAKEYREELERQEKEHREALEAQKRAMEEQRKAMEAQRNEMEAVKKEAANMFITMANEKYGLSSKISFREVFHRSIADLSTEDMKKAIDDYAKKRKEIEEKASVEASLPTLERTEPVEPSSEENEEKAPGFKAYGISIYVRSEKEDSIVRPWIQKMKEAGVDIHPVSVD